jgi:hypothetical protein
VIGDNRLDSLVFEKLVAVGNIGGSKGEKDRGNSFFF